MIAFVRGIDQRHPLPVALAIVLCFVLYFLSPLVLGGAGQSGPDGVDSQEVASSVWMEFGLVLAVLLAVAMIGDWNGMHFNTRPVLHRAWVFIPVLAYLSPFWLSSYAGLQDIDAGILQQLLPIFGGVVITTALVGIFEEFLFRGILFRAISLAYGAVVAFFLSSILFGAMHYVNMVNGQSFENTSLQVLHAIGGGLLYCGLMLYLNSIWPAVVLHALWDTTVLITQSLSPAILPTDVAQMAQDPGGISLFQAAVLGFEPLFGLVLFFLWLRQRSA